MPEKAGLGISEATLSRAYTVHCGIMHHTMHGEGSLNTWSLAGLVLSGIVAMLNYNTEDSWYMPLGTPQQYCVCTL